MKKCNTELMKEIKMLEEKKEDILSLERESCKITYLEGEKKLPSNYDYNAVRKNVDAIDAEVRRYKALLAYSNATTIVPEFNMTIGECLVYLAQLNKKKDLIANLSNCKQLTRVSSAYNTKVEYVEVLFNVDKVKKELEEVQRLISQLQIAIDRVNLTNMIDC